jgi:hypothetical protein
MPNIPPQIRNPNQRPSHIQPRCLRFGISDLGFDSDFGLRISDLTSSTSSLPQSQTPRKVLLDRSLGVTIATVARPEKDPWNLIRLKPA